MKVQRLSADARVALLRAARAEATGRGDRYVGTEHMLLGLLAEPDGVAERALGFSLDEMRVALRRFDGDALDAVGVDVVLPVATGRAVVRRRLPFTSGAKRALVRALGQAARRRSASISTGDLLLGLLMAEAPDPALLLLRYLGCDVDYVRRILLAEGE